MKCSLKTDFFKHLEIFFKRRGGFSCLKKDGACSTLPMHMLYRERFLVPGDCKVRSGDIEEVFSENFIVFVDGAFSKDLSKVSDSFELELLDPKSSEIKNFFYDINFLSSKHKLFLKVKKSSSCQIINIVTGKVALFPKLHIVVGEGVSLGLVFTGKSLFPGFFFNKALDIELEKDSEVECDISYFGLKDGYIFNSLNVTLGENSKLFLNNILFGSKVEHHDIRVKLLDRGRVFFNNLAILKKRDIANVSTNIVHEGMDSFSKIRSGSVLKNSSKGSFLGRVFISGDRSKSVQENKNLIVGGRASAFSRPFLEVTNDSAEASHFATFSRVLDEELFYLRSRGLSKYLAEKLLILGFCDEVINGIKVGSLKKVLKRIVGYGR